MPEGATARAVPAYADAVARFSIETAAAQLDGDLERGLNACVECCDRHAKADAIALDWIDAGGQHHRFTFAQMQALSARVAHLLVAQGVKPGDVVAGMLPRTPELVATILGTWRAGAVYQPLFTAFGPKAIEHRLRMSGARLVVTNVANRAKLDEIADCPAVATVREAGETLPAHDIDFRAALAAQSDTFEPVLRKGSDLFMMMSTSGTTGLPKGVPVPLYALLAFGAYMREAVDLRASDRFWNIADPGWAYGLYYAITGPLLLGHATTLYEGSFTVDSTYDVIERLGITSLAGSPTAYRMLMAAGNEAAARLKGQLRVVSSAGEPLNPEVVRWFHAALGAPIHDHYGQTELGMVVNNHHGLTHVIHAGSAGLAMPGYRVAVLDEAGRELGPGEPGNLAIDIARSPLLWFRGYWQQDTPAIAGGYYRTGDNVELEPDGTVSFIGRADDVITSSGYRIGPFDVESALIEHPAVSEAAVIGVPDPERTEIVKAFVVLSKGFDGTPELAEELSLHVKRRLSAHAYPRAIDFVDALPKTPSGKIQRFVLRKMEAEKAAQP
ncbi:acyl-CoA synthetase [Burkholderia cenocepacia]|uniref:Acyl-CoA synthetase n=1 Tax=Burkholderia cenocepacia TaxID=95486 RepID=A0ABD4UP70_9BURK|nr:acyl-CoA synthetase [Burkholderia cenocepacia]MBR7970980.1 acyl-CoA synthetase [Burkholderia cenocepacia]MBR8270639.1 acyl-CoA synthetase [Burkholderia cenocepacia]MBR8434983.1 acyl-CoA synthetase [Burkholderia cenocepacia]MCW3641230.1 acyl-CoA synthetase [Burkholderia cenocepacia]MCW3692075.1 acyl-CoA synthetase [Burkholderia cenocepacia]